MVKETKIAAIFLAITVTLWLLVLLLIFRIINIFDASLMNFPDPVIIWGAMILYPIGMIYQGLKIKRVNQSRRIPEEGATAPQRDAIDQRVVDDVRNGTSSIIDSPKDIGGDPELETGIAPVDSDHAGMSDEWETELRMDPLDPSDRNGDLDGNGYHQEL